jgi:hypothetical protein
MQRLMERFRTLVSCAAPLLAAEHLQQGESFFPELASSLLAFNVTLGEADQEYPRYRIRQRVSRASRAGVPASLRRHLDEVWTTANALRIVLDRWGAWFVELQEKGDADPARALTYDDLARRSITVLLTHCPNVAPFDRADEGMLLAMLPPIPAWWMPGTDVRLPGGETDLSEEPRVGWQQDRAFLDRYYWSPERRLEKATQLRAAATRLIDLLVSFPMTALASRRSGSR